MPLPSAGLPRRYGRRRLAGARIATLALGLALLAGPVAARTASIVIDAGSGAVLAASEPTQRWYPASLTKLMTLYLVFQAIEGKRLQLADRLTVSAHAAAQPATGLGLAAGEKISIKDAILAVITQSANDAAVALAEAAAGSETAFVAAMNSQAGKLGMAQTRFANASGLPDPGEATSARDMAMLARALQHDFPQHYHFFAARQVEFHRTSLPTINAILGAYRGADGLKTGFTCDSGYNLVASAMRDERRLIAVVLGAPNRANRTAAMVQLLDRGFATPASATLAATLLPPSGDPPPPHQLGPGECEVGTGPVARGILPGRGAPPSVLTSLPGWGLVLGAYPGQQRARAVVARAKATLGSSTRSGTPLAIARKGTRLYSALLVGLNERQAGAACLLLRSRGAFCLKLTPAALNNPDAVWR
jgi:D-alanyl-D-alanine carboxypeptidase